MRTFVPCFLPRVLLALAALASPGAPPASAQTVTVKPVQTTTEDLPREIEGSRIARIWRFEHAGDTEGWQPFQNVALEVADGRLLIRNTGDDPYLIGPELFADASEYQFLALRIRASAEGLTQLFYNRRDEPGFREAQMIALPTKGDGQWHFHEIDLRPIRNWSGPIERLRIDPVNGVAEAGAVVEIDWIALYQTPAQIEPSLPWWNANGELVLGFRNRGGQNAAAPIELFWEGVPIGVVACLDSPGEAEVAIDASALPATFWVEARLAGERMWRGRIVKPVEPEPLLGHVDAEEIGARATIAVGAGVAVLSNGPARAVRLAPVASLSIRGPGREISYYEFDVAPRAADDATTAARVFEGWIDDPLVGALVCTTTVADTAVRTTLESSAPLEILRFEGPRMLESRPHTHAILPGLEYVEAGEDSSRDVWTGPGEADRSTPEPHKITIPMIAVEYDRAPAPRRRVAPRPIEAAAALAPKDPAGDPGDGDQGAGKDEILGRDRAHGAWVAGLIWDIDNSEGISPSPPTGEFVSRAEGLSYAAAYLPSSPDVRENHRYATDPLELGAFEPLELETRFVLEPGTIEQAFERHWTHAVPPPPTLAWAAADEDLPDERRAGPGSQAAIERIVAISMLAYTDTLFDLATPGWKTHIAVGEAYAQRRLLGAIVLGESLRAGRPEYATAVGIEDGGQIEEWIGNAHSFVDDTKRREACEIFARVGPDGGIGYVLTPAMKTKIEEFTAFYGLHYDDFGVEGETNSGLTALQVFPLLEYAACTLDPIFVAAAERVLAKINSFTVPRGAQTWEIHMQTPDLYAAARSALCNVWGYRMTGDEHYLDEAQRWVRTGIPFLYLWEPPVPRRVRSVHVNDGEGEGQVLAERDPGLFYADVRRQVNPYASIPVFGTSWYAVTWLGIPVQWCGLAWGNVVRELDALRPMPNLVDVADGVFRSGANQQCDSSYLAGTLPDSWDVASALSRQPYIIPDRILEYAYRVLGAPYLDSLQYLRLAGPRWTHVASRALLEKSEPGEAHALALTARFFRDQNASVLVGGSAAPASVRVNGRAIEEGDGPWTRQWIEWEPGRGGLVVRWVATGGDDRIEVLAR